MCNYIAMEGEHACAARVEEEEEEEERGEGGGVVSQATIAIAKRCYTRGRRETN